MPSLSPDKLKSLYYPCVNFFTHFPIHRRAVWAVSVHFCALVSRDHVSWKSIIQSLNGRVNKWISQQIKEYANNGHPFRCYSTNHTSAFEGYGRWGPNEYNILFVFLFALFKESTTALTATGSVGYKHCDAFWPLNPIHYGICKEVIIFKMIIWTEADGISVVAYRFLHLAGHVPPPLPLGNITFAMFLSPPNLLPTPAICFIMRALKIS